MLVFLWVQVVKQSKKPTNRTFQNLSGATPLSPGSLSFPVLKMSATKGHCVEGMC